MTKKKVIVNKEVKSIDTLKKLLIAITIAYPNDATAPGLVLSYLKKGKYYGSITRYFEKYGAGKYVVGSRTAPTVHDVLKLLAEDLLIKKDIFDDLRKSL